MTNYELLVKTHELGTRLSIVLENADDPELCRKLKISQNADELPAEAIARYMNSPYVPEATK